MPLSGARQARCWEWSRWTYASVSSALLPTARIGVTKPNVPDSLLQRDLMILRACLIAALVTPTWLLAEENAGETTLPGIKAIVRFHSDSNGIVPDNIELPASTLLTDKQRRVIEGNLGRLPIRIYVRETPNQPRATIEVNVVNTQANKPLAGYPAKQDVGPLGMLSFNIPVTTSELETLVHTTKKSTEGKLGKVESISLHVDIDIPVKPETNADGDPILDCDDLLRQDHFVVDDVAQKLNDTSNHGYQVVNAEYTSCLDKQTDTLAGQLKPDDKKMVDRIRQLLPDLAPVSFDSAVNQNGGVYFSMLALAGVGVDAKQAETSNHLARQLGVSSTPNPAARKAVATAFAACQAAIKKFVPAPENAGDEANAADLKKQFQTDLEKAKTALKELQTIAAKLPDNSAMLLAQSTLSILTTAQGFE